MGGHPTRPPDRERYHPGHLCGLFVAISGVSGNDFDDSRKGRQERKKETRTRETSMNMNSYVTWALLGAAGGAGFGLFAVPLIYILINLESDGVTFGQTVRFAVANGATWGVLGLFAGVFLWVINTMRKPPTED